MTRLQRDTIAYLLITVFCIVMLVWVIPVYTPPYPGYGASPALVPIVSVCIMLFMSVLALVRNVIAKYANKTMPRDEAEFPEDSDQGGFTQVGRIRLDHLAKFVVPCVLLIAGIEYLGYLPIAFLFMLTIQFVMGSKRPVRAVIVAIATVATLYIIMRYGFGVPIPGPQLI